MSMGSALFGLSVLAQAALLVITTQVPEVSVQPLNPAAPEPHTLPEGVGFANIGQIILFLTTVVGILAQLYRDRLKTQHDDKVAERLAKELEAREKRQMEKEERQRRWDLEDRQRAREEQREQTRLTAEALAKKTEFAKQ